MSASKKTSAGVVRARRLEKSGVIDGILAACGLALSDMQDGHSLEHECAKVEAAQAWALRMRKLAGIRITNEDESADRDRESAVLEAIEQSRCGCANGSTVNCPIHLTAADNDRAIRGES